MLPRKNRISKNNFPSPKRQGFPNQQVRALGVNFSSPLFSGVIYRKEGSPRIAVVVSKKTAKTAVVRNRIRRRFYAALTPLIKGSTQGGLMVFYPKKEAATVPFAVLMSEVATAVKKLC